jgi:hypothetical protein
MYLGTKRLPYICKLICFNLIPLPGVAAITTDVEQEQHCPPESYSNALTTMEDKISFQIYDRSLVPKYM